MDKGKIPRKPRAMLLYASCNGDEACLQRSPGDRWDASVAHSAAQDVATMLINHNNNFKTSFAQHGLISPRRDMTEYNVHLGSSKESEGHSPNECLESRCGNFSCISSNIAYVHSFASEGKTMDIARRHLPCCGTIDPHYDSSEANRSPKQRGPNISMKTLRASFSGHNDDLQAFNVNSFVCDGHDGEVVTWPHSKEAPRQPCGLDVSYRPPKRKAHTPPHVGVTMTTVTTPRNNICVGNDTRVSPQYAPPPPPSRISGMSLLKSTLTSASISPDYLLQGLPTCPGLVDSFQTSPSNRDENIFLAAPTFGDSSDEDEEVAQINEGCIRKADDAMARGIYLRPRKRTCTMRQGNGDCSKALFSDIPSYFILQPNNMLHRNKTRRRFG